MDRLVAIAVTAAILMVGLFCRRLSVGLIAFQGS